MSRKILAVLLSIIMALSMCVTASAETGASENETGPGTYTTADLKEKVNCYKDVNLLSGKYVYYPSEMENTDKKYPVVTWANGSWCPVQTYLPIIEGIAASGYIVVADTDLLTDDGVSTIDSVDYIINANEDEDSPFYGRVDTDSIGSTGHSLGGQAAVVAAGQDSRIKAIVSLAGKSSANEASRVTVPALYLAGTLDMIVSADSYVYPSYKASRGPKAYAAFNNMTHFGVWLSPADYVKYTVAWFDAYLKGETEKVEVFEEGGTLSQDSTWVDFECANLTSAEAAEATKEDKTKSITIAGQTISYETDRLGDVYIYEDVNDYYSGHYVLYPEEMLTNKKKYPVIIWANGSWCPVQTYYGYLQGLASQGFIVVADTDLYTKNGDSVLESIDYIKEINSDESTIFYNRLDTDKIGATGHSLGGEAIVNACAETTEIKCLVSLAGCSTAAEVEAMNSNNAVPTLYFAGQYDINVPKNKYVVTSYNTSSSAAVYVDCVNVEHFAVWYSPDLYISYATEWFDLYLNGNTENKSIFAPGGELANDTRYEGYMSKGL